ncbi:hypothetical protein ASG87_14920 [Frateuria sp. Soil773]|uniref:isochorismatase family protein n=1 Tax=Frateuria sp. Soil773 TaxID=1736407 RepID=UPI0006FC3133|nr:isochorismatase family protein [Frateuria sp. Soil773]KRE97815.1 hypothetical protein ASG87_14920 [Frateuria sp. Soil773]
MPAAEQVPRHDAAEALIVVVAQRAFMAGDGAVPERDRLERALRMLLGRAREAGAPVVFLQNDGLPGAADAPGQAGWELFLPPTDGERVIRKTQDDGFEGTGLDACLAALGVRRLALCGLLSEMCLAATARAAMARGYAVLLPHDGHATYDVPAGPGGSPVVPARLAARAAEWSLCDGIEIPPSAADVRFSGRAGR